MGYSIPITGSFSKPRRVTQAQLLCAHCGPLAPVRGWATYRASTWNLNWVRRGALRVRLGQGSELQFPAEVASLYEPGLVFHELQPGHETVDSAFIRFDLSGETRASFQALTRPGHYCLFQDPAHLIGGMLERLALLLFHRRPGFEWVTEGLFLELIGLLLQSHPVARHLRQVSDQQRARSHLAFAVELYIQRHIAELIRVRDLARHVGLSDWVFNHRYVAETSESPYRTVLRLKAEAAKRLLLTEQLSVKETAERLGFSSPFHFSRVFTRLEGLSPSHYQRAMQR